jgi:hypothetical protein
MKTFLLNSIPKHDLKQKELEFLALNLMISSLLIAVFCYVMAMPKTEKIVYRAIAPIEYYQAE